MPRVLASVARVVSAAVVVGLLAACQPIDSGVPTGDPAAPAGTVPPEAAGQAAALPADLDALLAQLGSTAREWQDDPVVAEVFVDLDGEAWREALVAYLAADADRMLVVRVGAQGTSQQRPTLGTLELDAVPGAALAEVPPPGELLEPGVLVERAAVALEDCGVGDVASVLYATGAPAAWDGQTWTERPAWTAMLSGAERAAVVDPRTGEPAADPCVDAG